MGKNSFHNPRNSSSITDEEDVLIKRSGGFTRHKMSQLFLDDNIFTIIPRYEDSIYERDKTVIDFLNEIKNAYQNEAASLKMGMVWLETDLKKENVNYIVEGRKNILYSAILLSYFDEKELLTGGGVFSWKNMIDSAVALKQIEEWFALLDLSERDNFKEYFLNACFCVQFHV